MGVFYLMLKHKFFKVEYFTVFFRLIVNSAFKI